MDQTRTDHSGVPPPVGLSAYHGVQNLFCFYSCLTIISRSVGRSLGVLPAHLPGDPKLLRCLVWWVTGVEVFRYCGNLLL